MPAPSALAHPGRRQGAEHARLVGVMVRSSGEQDGSSRGTAAGRRLAEIAVTLSASLIIALMVLGGGIVIERMPVYEPVIAARIFPEPAPVSWNETQ